MVWGAIISLVIVFAPCSAWTPDILLWWQVPLGVLFLILYMGILLFDTLFFDRYN
jgi:hypothetical protein